MNSSARRPTAILSTVIPSAALIAVALLAAPLPALSQPASVNGTQAQPVAMPVPPSLDTLFSQLRREDNERGAERIARLIQDRWRDSGSATINLLTGWADDAIRAQKYAAALDFLDQVTVLQPDYAEGWNKRATLHFMMKNYAKAMTDIGQTLKLEPRHFGALAGMGRILKDTGRTELALKAYEQVLAVYPMMRSAQNEVATLSDELAGESL